MGFFGDLVDDVLDVPGKALRCALEIPAQVIEAARKAGCKTEKEIQEFFDQLEG